MAERDSGTHEALLDAAERLFSDKGYAAVGIREIVESADVNLAAIKYHFGSKRELYLETVRRAMQRREAAQVWQVLEEAPLNRKAARVKLVCFIRMFLYKLLSPTSGGDASAKLLLREASQPSEAIDAVVRDFIQPNERILMHVVKTLAPESDRKQLSRHAQSILGQILHYRVFRPFLERMSEGAVENPGEIDSISEHITRFSLRALGCTKSQIEEALAEAATSERI